MFCRDCFPKGMVQSSSRCPRSPPLGVEYINRIQDGSKVVPDPRVVHVPGSLDWGSQVTSSGIFRQTGSGSFLIKSKGSLAGKQARNRMVQFTAIYLAKDFYRIENVFLETGNITSPGELPGMCSLLLPLIFLKVIVQGRRVFVLPKK